MPYTIPTYEELRNGILEDFAAQFADADTSEHSDLYVWSCVLAALAEGEYGFLDFLGRQVTPDLAEAEFLTRWAKVYIGDPLPEAPAAGTTTVTGAEGAVVPSGTLLTFVGGQQYLTTAETTIPAAGNAALSVESVESGYDQNRTAGEILTFDSPPSGVDAATVVVAVSGGRSAETDTELRARVLLRTQNSPGGGNRTDWERWAREVAGVAEVAVYPVRRGLGTVDVVALGAAGARVLSAAVLTEVETHLEALRPVTCDLAVRTAAANPLDLVVEVVPASGYEFDWSGSRTLEAGSTAGSLVLDSVAGLLAGDRIVAGLEQREIEAIDEGTATITLTAALSTAPAEGSHIYPGGPLYEPIRDSVRAYIEGLAPLDTWYRNACEAAAAVPGVLNPTVSSPATDQALTDDDTASGPPLNTLGSLVVTEAT